MTALAGDGTGRIQPALAALAELVCERTGIELPESRMPALARAVDRVAPGADLASFLATVRAPGGAAVFARLIDEVTIRETYFFRESRQLGALDWQRLLRGARDRGDGEVRVWVPGCASGEDAYLLAMLASEAFRPRRPPVRVLGTDISRAALERSAAGSYGERSVRDLPAALRGRYLAEDGGRHRVVASLLALVHFRGHNLARDAYPPAGEVGFDVIACRNVLIYLGAAVVPRVLAGFERALHPGGVIVLGSADRLSASQARPAEPRQAAPRARDEPLPRDARAVAARAIAAEPLDAGAHHRLGAAELEAGDPDAAVASFRRALYADPGYALAAFDLGRAHDAAGDERAARRAYEQALRTIESPGTAREHRDEADLDDVAARCRARLADLAGAERG